MKGGFLQSKASFALAVQWHRPSYKAEGHSSCSQVIPCVHSRRLFPHYGLAKERHRPPRPIYDHFPDPRQMRNLKFNSSMNGQLACYCPISVYIHIVQCTCHEAQYSWHIVSPLLKDKFARNLGIEQTYQQGALFYQCLHIPLELYQHCFYNFKDYLSCGL